MKKIAFLISALLFASSAWAGDCPRHPLVNLHSSNQLAYGLPTGVVLPQPQLDVLPVDQGCPVDWRALRLQRIETLVNAQLDRIHFDFDSSALDEPALVVVNELVALLQQNQDVGLLLSGHTDAVGSDVYNLALSARRAQAVQTALAVRGIAVARLRMAYLGESQLLVNSQGRERQNRRVEAQVFDTLIH